MVRIFVFILLMLSTSSLFAAKWNFPVNITYLHGFWNVYDIMDDNIGGASEITMLMPVGTSFQPYVQLENNIRVGFGCGPAVFFLTNSDAAGNFFSLPVNFSLGYTFSPDSPTTPYLRGGVSYPLATGKNVKSSSPGALVGFGIEFNRKGNYCYNIEVGYDLSEVEMAHRNQYASFEKIKPVSLIVSFGIVF